MYIKQSGKKHCKKTLWKVNKKNVINLVQGTCHQKVYMWWINPEFSPFPWTKNNNKIDILVKNKKCVQQWNFRSNIELLAKNQNFIRKFRSKTEISSKKSFFVKIEIRKNLPFDLYFWHWPDLPLLGYKFRTTPGNKIIFEKWKICKLVKFCKKCRNLLKPRPTYSVIIFCIYIF